MKDCADGHICRNEEAINALRNSVDVLTEQHTEMLSACKAALYRLNQYSYQAMQKEIAQLRRVIDNAEKVNA